MVKHNSSFLDVKLENTCLNCSQEKKFCSKVFGPGGYWGCAAGWGRIFTTRLTIMGVTFLVELLEWGHTFSGFLG